MLLVNSRVRLKTVRAFELWVADEANVEDVLGRIAGGLTLQKAALALNKPYMCLHAYFHSTPELEGRYSAARRSWADSKQDEAMEIADEVKPERDEVAKAKLRVEVRQNQAKAYNPDRWGDRLRVERSEAPAADLGLLGTVVEMLRVATQKALPERVVSEIAPGQALDAGSAEAESTPSAALPAPAVAKG